MRRVRDRHDSLMTTAVDVRLSKRTLLDAELPKDSCVVATPILNPVHVVSVAGADRETGADLWECWTHIGAEKERSFAI